MNSEETGGCQTHSKKKKNNNDQELNKFTPHPEHTQLGIHNSE